MKKRMKRFLAIILSAAMVLSYTGVSFAEELISELVPAEAAENIEMAEAVEAEEAAEMAAEEAGAEAESAGPAEWQEKVSTQNLMRRAKDEEPNLKIVTLGASNVNGYGLRGYLVDPNKKLNADEVMEAAALDSELKSNANVLGYNQCPEGSYPAILRDELNAGLQQLAISSMRAEELRILLDNGYMGDAYSEWRFIGKGKWFDIADGTSDGDFSKLRSEYQAAVSDADLITVDIGVNNFGVYLSSQLTNGFKYDKDIDHIDPEIGKKYAEVYGQLDKILAGYGVKIEKYKDFVDTLAYALIGFCYNFDKSMERIYELNPDADVVVVSIQNLMTGLKAKIGDDVLPFGDMMGALINTANSYIAVGSPYASKYMCADVRKDGRVEFFIDKMAAYDGYPENLDKEIIDCFDVWDKGPGVSYSSGLHVKYKLAEYAIKNIPGVTVDKVGEYLNGEGRIYLNAVYDAYAQILSAAAKVDTLDFAALSLQGDDMKKIQRQLEEAILNTLISALNGRYEMPENFFCLAGQENEEIAKTIAAMAVRTDIGNSFFGHPTKDGHREVADAILDAYKNRTRGKDIIADEVGKEASEALEELQRILGELAAETGEFVESYTMDSEEYKKLIVEIENLQALLEGDRNALYADLTEKAEEAKALADGRLSELKIDLDSQEEFLKGKGEEYWGRAVTLEEHTEAAVDDIEKAYNEAKIALKELCEAEKETYQTIIEKLPDAKKVVNVAVIPDMQDAVKAFAAMKNSSVRLAGKVKAAEAAVKNFENVTDEKTAAICAEVKALHDDLAALHDEGVETFNQKMAQYATELKDDGETIRGMIEEVYALLMDQAAGIEAQCEEIKEIAKGIPEDIYQYAEKYAEKHGLIEKYGVPVGAAYFAVTEIRKLLEEYPDMPEKAWEYAEQTGLLDKLDQALNDLFEKYSEAVNEELNAMIEELQGELSGLEDCEFSKEEFEKKAEEVCGLLKEKYEYLQNELEKIKRLENCLRIASDYLLGEASQAAKELGNEIWQIVDAFEKGFNEAKQQTIAQLEAKLAEIRTELSQFQTELAGKICEEIRRTEAMIREMAEKGKAGVIEMSGMICDMMKKICSEIREVVYDATHTDYYMHKGNNYVALGGKTLNAYYLNCDDIAAQRYSRLVADALTEEYKKPVKDDVKTDLDLTVINGEAFVKKNAEKLAEADLITYQVDADVKTLVKILMGESKGDVSDYVPADTLEIARRLEDVLEEILVSDWSEETQKKADEAKKKLVEAVNAYVLAIYDGSDPELIVNEEYLASVDRHIERVMDAMIAKMVETAGVLNAQKEAALAGVIENRALIRDYFEKATYIAIAYAVETVKVSETMRAINPEAAILLVGMYNPLQGVTVKLGEDTINVGNLFDYIIMASNMYCTAYAAVSETVTYVAVPGTKIGMEPQTINVNDPAEIVKAIFGIVTDDKATYATVAGHENIKERIIDALNVIPYTLTGIAVTAAPAKTSYVEGQSFDPTGMEITAAYSDGTSEVVSGWTVTDGEALTAGKQSVTISYTEDGVEATTTQAVTVVTKVPTALTVKTAPAKTAYVAGQAFDPTGMVVVATYNDGTSAETKSYVVIGGDALTEGQTSVTISYTSGETVTTTQAITVVAKVPTGITVKKAPAKTAYVAGENFDPTGMVVEAAYNDGTTAEITGYEVINGNALTEGQTSVTISYTVGSTTVTTTQAITVKAKYTPVYYGGGSVSYVLFTGTWNNPVTNGTWIQDANGVWHYGTTQQFRNTWAYIYNPYAGEGQNKNDWFWFDANGNMLTGWQFINGKWYYLNPTMDGTLGACLLGPGKTPDGWEIDASGAWTGR